MNAVRLDGVSRAWCRGPQAIHALRDISLTIEGGEFVSISGPSGSGKSTLLNVLGALDRGYTGSVRIADVEPRALRDRALSAFRSRTVGFVFQSFHLLPHLTVLENVLVPTTFAGTEGAEERARALLARVGLDARLDARPGELSGGQQQRVAIARALVNRPKLVLCDEPTGSLDEATGRDILALLRQVNDEDAATLIIVTHEPHIANAARRRIVLRDGNIAEDEIGEAS